MLNQYKRICKLCFENIRDDNLAHLFSPNLLLCQKCYQRLIPKLINFDVDNYKALSLYQYDEDIRALLYQLKGCFDYELAGVFLDRYTNYYRLIYSGYIIVPIPSYAKDDEVREFNHVVEIFKLLNLQMLFLLKKTARVKQANSTSIQRKDIHKYLQLVDRPDLSNKKILIVDDVYTTGSTMKAAIALIRQLNPKKIRVLVMSKTKLR